MDYQYLIVEREGEVVRVTISAPQTLNALNSTILRELDSLFDEVAAWGTRVVVLTGAGRSFVAGADISEMKSLSAEEGEAFGRFGALVFRKIEMSPAVVIAAVNGFALGGGCELAMACDIRIASTAAKFGQPEVGLGITPGFTGTQRLPRIVGVGKAKELLYTGGTIKADEAYRIGLVNAVVEPDQLMETVEAMVAKILSQSPMAVRKAKEAVNLGIDCEMDVAIVVENQLFGSCFGTPEQQEGMEAFLAKRKPDFSLNK